MPPRLIPTPRWEIANQLEKLWLVGFMTLIANDTIVQLGIAMAVSLTFMLISSVAAPFRRKEDTYFAVACHFSLTATFFFCAMLKVKVLVDEMEDNLSEQLKDRFDFDEVLRSATLVLPYSVASTLRWPCRLRRCLHCSTHHGSTVQVVLGSCLFAVIVASLVLACILAVQSILEAAAVPTFRLVATGNRPDLALAEGHLWHLFLSQCASSLQTATTLAMPLATTLATPRARDDCLRGMLAVPAASGARGRTSAPRSSGSSHCCCPAPPSSSTWTTSKTSACSRSTSRRRAS